ncbi:MAG TPA: hypothetical protein ENN69_07980, partial [Spirochaetia bacterium]|nr:hypothetical protein [Spirochaetia bacterium]
MRRRCIFLTLLFSFVFAVVGITSGLPQGEAADTQVDLQDQVTPLYPRYEFYIDLLVQNHHARVREKMTVANTTRDAWKRIVFSVPPAATANVFTLAWLTVTVGGRTVSVTPTFDGSMMIVDFPVSVAPRAEVQIMLGFTLTLRRLKPWEAHPLGNLGYGDKVMQFGDCFPVITPYDDATGFRIWHYVPVGDPYVYINADYNVVITTDRPVLIAAAGLVTHSGNLWEFHLHNARSFAFTASAEYDFVSGVADEIPVYVYYVKGKERAARAVLTTAVQCLSLYASLYGPYPYPELVLAQNAYASAMEYAGFVTISNAYMQNYSTSPQLLFFITSHEIAHQWWY